MKKIKLLLKAIIVIGITIASMIPGSTMLINDIESVCITQSLDIYENNEKITYNTNDINIRQPSDMTYKTKEDDKNIFTPFNKYESVNLNENDSKTEDNMPDFVPGCLLIKFKSGIDISTPNKAIREINNITNNNPSFAKVISAKPLFSEEMLSRNAEKKHEFGLNRIVIIEFEDKNVNIHNETEKYLSCHQIEYVEPNYIAKAMYTPNDPRVDEQWALENIQAFEGWDIEQGNSDVIIAVVDTGVDYTHEDIQEKICPVMYDFVEINTVAYENDGWGLIDGEDYINEDDDPMDFNGHGTHCAGIAAAQADNSIGISGVCPYASIMAIRAGFGIDHPSSTIGEVVLLEYDDIIQAIVFAADNGADVISMSFGGSTNDNMYQAICYAYVCNVTLIAAAGNSNSLQKLYPAAYDEVIAVAATAQDDVKTYYSNWGFWVDISAPGGDYYKDTMILSTVPTTGGINANPSGYQFLQGTSMACPHVAGLAALIKSRYPEASPNDIKARLLLTTDDISMENPEYFFLLGTGRLNVYNALNAESVLQVQISYPAPGTTIITPVHDNISIIGSATGENFTQYQLFYGPAYPPFEWIEFTDPVLTPVEEGILGNLSLGELPTDQYCLKLQATTVNGEQYQHLVPFSIEHNIIQITTNPKNQRMPRISGDRIIWIDARNYYGSFQALGIGQIFLYDLGNLAAGLQPITPDVEWFEGYGCDVSGDLIAWSKPPLCVSDVFLYDLANPEYGIMQITNHYGDQERPAISGNRIVYNNDPDGGGDTYRDDIYLCEYDPVTGTLTKQRITFYDDSFQQVADISGDLIVYMSGELARTSDIYLYNITSQEETQITDFPDAGQAFPKISGNWIVWQDYRNDPFPGRCADIYAYNITTQEEIQITYNTSHQEHPSVSGDCVVWTDYRNNNWGDIYLYNLTTRQEKRITSDHLHSKYPWIYDDRIVWMDGRNGAWDIYMYLPSDTLLADAGGPYNGYPGESIHFTGSAFGMFQPFTWHWDFGDGNTSEDQNPTHIYSAADTFTVTLTVTDSASLPHEAVDIATAVINEPEPLEANAHGPYEGYVGENIEFKGSAYGGIEPYTWHWDFGDDIGESDEQNPIYNYIATGTYTVTLTVIDSAIPPNEDSITTTATIFEDTTPPVVEIIKPDKALYIKNKKIMPLLLKPLIIGNIDIVINATDDLLGVDKVEIYIDNKLKTTDTSEPYSWTWDERTPFRFRHTIKVIAYDEAGNYAASEISVRKFF